MGDYWLEKILSYKERRIIKKCFRTSWNGMRYAAYMTRPAYVYGDHKMAGVGLGMKKKADTLCGAPIILPLLQMMKMLIIGHLQESWQ